MNRRIIIVLGCFVLLFSFTLSVYAAGMKEYSLDELGMTISMPSDYIVFLRDMDANDSKLSAYGLTKDSMSSLMNERNIYLNGWDTDVNNEIIITMIDSLLADFNLFSDTTLSTMETSLESEYQSVGITVIKSEIYQHKQAKFLKIYISQPNEGSTMYGLQYYTVYSNKAINISMQSYAGQITASQEVAIKKIVNSAEFDTEPQMPETNSLPANAFTYTDTKTKATFVIPANWVETPLTKDREYIDVKFTSIEEEGMSILYGSVDLWNEMTVSERSGYIRSDIDNSFIMKSDIADVLGIATKNIESVTYGGKNYYSATANTKTNNSGLNITVSITHVIYIENGYMHWFQFSGEKGNKLYVDFESMLTSVNFPQPTSTEPSETDSKPSSQFTLGSILISIFITITVYSLPIFIFRYAIRKEPIEKKEAKKITIKYGICAFIVMSVLVFAFNGSGATGVAILLWSWVNYRMLIGGKMQSDVSASVDSTTLVASISETKQTVSSTKMDNQDNFTSSYESQEKVCHNCGALMPVESEYCHKCGTKMFL